MVSSGGSGVTLKNNVSGIVYTFEAIKSVSYSINILLSQMPIPTQQTPYLLNLGGTQIDITLTFITTVMADVSNLITNFASAQPNTSFTLDLTNVWGANMVFNGIVQILTITQASGQILWDGSITFAQGILVS